MYVLQRTKNKIEESVCAIDVIANEVSLDEFASQGSDCFYKSASAGVTSTRMVMGEHQ